MQAYSLLSEPPGKPKNTRVGSLSLSPGDLPYPGVPCIESEVMKSLSHVQLFAIPWTVVYQASLSMGFSRQEYWSGLPFPPSKLVIKPVSPAWQVYSLPLSHLGSPLCCYYFVASQDSENLRSQVAKVCGAIYIRTSCVDSWSLSGVATWVLHTLHERDWGADHISRDSAAT